MPQTSEQYDAIEKFCELSEQLSFANARLSNMHNSLISYQFRGREVLEFALATQDSSVIDIELADVQYRKNIHDKMYPHGFDHDLDILRHKWESRYTIGLANETNKSR